MLSKSPKNQITVESVDVPVLDEERFHHVFMHHDLEEKRAEVVAEIIKFLEEIYKKDCTLPKNITMFHIVNKSKITPAFYIDRIALYGEMTTAALIAGMVYLSRYIMASGQALTGLNLHRLVLTSIMLGAKNWDDRFYSNAYYAKVGGVPLAEMNALEENFLDVVNFNFFIEIENMCPSTITNLFKTVLIPSSQRNELTTGPYLKVGTYSPLLFDYHYAHKEAKKSGAKVPSTAPLSAKDNKEFKSNFKL